jgi:hypothetical protein
MPDSDTSGAPPAARPRIRFGDNPTQVMPAEWAEHMFRALRSTERGRKQFGTLLAQAADSGGARDVTVQ